ncbi:methylmalonyl-CoA mutase family protein [Candidatus Poriferisodalis sp.]|uniref:methylmalonyl-CoA mutase family protein n=1 Tax=Candidatus Poriferisodalis sp. TaxID=3101277 RepID=UPI003B015C79
MGGTEAPQRSRPWLMRTYSGHSTARASNELYRSMLAAGQTGLSVAFDLPTQTGYDPDHPMARGEVGKVGVPVSHLGHMAQLMDGIPPDAMNTSMTINATAPWLLGLYIANAHNAGAAPDVLRGTTQNDIVKEYLSRGTYIFGPEASRRLTTDVVAYCSAHLPQWNPINVCSYHLQEAGATPTQEIAYALAGAIDVLDAVRDSGKVPPERFGQTVGSISFFVNGGIRFVEEVCKVRAFTAMWDRICADRYGVADPKQRRFRYGVQVNSLGLTEAQPENNVARITLEALGVTLSQRARTRSLQLPAWNEALGLPRLWDQQWSLRIQQVLAHETDLLDHGDIFDGSHVIEGRTAELAEAAQAELDEVLSMGGAFAAISELKRRLVASHTERVRRIESGELTVVGVNTFTETAPSPLQGDESILRVDPRVEDDMVAELEQWRSTRDSNRVAAALDDLRVAASGDVNIMGPSIEAAHAGVTTGEWAQALREIFGEFRAPTGLGGAIGSVGNARGPSPAAGHDADPADGTGRATRRASRGSSLAALAARCAAMPGGPPRVLVAKPGLDGHSNGAEQVAVAARDAGMEVIYEGIRLTPSHIAATARDEDVDVVGLSILSGSHLELVPEVLDCLSAAGVAAPVVVGGIIPAADHERLIEAGVAAVYTPKDFELAAIMADIAALALAGRARAEGG